MRTLILSFIFVICACSAFGDKERDDLVEKCAKEHKVDKDVGMEILKLKKPAESEDEKCFVKCNGEGMGLFNADDGMLIPEGLVKNVPEELDATKIPDSIKKCEKLTGTTACDTSYLIGGCIWKDAIKAE